MSNFDDVTLFGSTTLADVFKQIHKNNKNVDNQIGELVDTLKPLASSNAGSAVMLMPTIKDLIDVGVKNNEHLIKMAAIAQRAATASSNAGNNIMDFINPDEIQQLLAEQEQIKVQAKELDYTLNNSKQLENK